ncbi:MAG: hypothetical protein ACE5R6_11865 [Candidatus Heimdallarchaeota archaeon]
MSTWQSRYTTANKKLKEITPLVTETEKQLRMVRKKLKNIKDDSIAVTLDAAIANLKKIQKIIMARHIV